MQRVVRYNVVLLQRDMAERGWQPTDLAARAGVATSTVTRFLNGEFQTAKTAMKLAHALGRETTRRYLLSDAEAVA